MYIKSKSGKVTTQKNSQSVDTGPSHQKDTLLKMTAVMTNSPVAQVETWEVLDQY